MNWRRVAAVARKEFLHVGRDPRSLAMGIAMPMVLLLLFGYALTLDVDRVPLVVWDQSQSPASRDWLSGFTGSRYFALQGQVRDYRELEEAIDSRRALLGLVVPADFGERVAAGRTATAQLIVDGSDPTTATLAATYADVVTQTHTREVQLHALRRAGIPPSTRSLELRPRAWFNDDLESRHFLVPGLMAVIMMIIAALLTSLTVAREWETGTMEQLISTPVKGPELVLGKLAPYFAIGLLDVVLAMLMGEFLFHVPLRGNLVLLLVMSVVFLVGTLSLGLLISIVTKNQMLANQLAMMVTFVPAFLLSGLVFPIQNMPSVIQAVTYLVPARYFVSLLRGIYLKGVGLDVLAPQAVFLVAFTLLMLALAVRKFRKQLE